MLSKILNFLVQYLNTTKKDVSIWVSGQFAVDYLGTHLKHPHRICADPHKCDLGIMIEADFRYDSNQINTLAEDFQNSHIPLLASLTEESLEGLLSFERDKIDGFVRSGDDSFMVALNDDGREYHDWLMKSIVWENDLDIVRRTSYEPSDIGNGIFVFHSIDLFCSYVMYNRLGEFKGKCIYINDRGDHVCHAFLDYLGRLHDIQIKSPVTSTDLLPVYQTFDRRKYSYSDYRSDSRKHDVYVSSNQSQTEQISKVLGVMKNFKDGLVVLADEEYDVPFEYASIDNRDHLKETDCVIHLGPVDETLLLQCLHYGCKMVLSEPHPYLVGVEHGIVFLSDIDSESHLLHKMHDLVCQDMDRSRLHKVCDKMSLSTNMSGIHSSFLESFDLFQEERMNIDGYFTQEITEGFSNQTSLDVFVVIDSDKSFAPMYDGMLELRNLTSNIYVLVDEFGVDGVNISLLQKHFKIIPCSLEDMNSMNLNTLISQTGSSYFVSVISPSIYMDVSHLGKFSAWFKNSVSFTDHAILFDVAEPNKSVQRSVSVYNRSSVFSNLCGKVSHTNIQPISYNPSKVKVNHYSEDLWVRSVSLPSNLILDDGSEGKCGVGEALIKITEWGMEIEGQRRVEVPLDNEMVMSRFYSIFDLASLSLEEDLQDIRIYLDEDLPKYLDVVKWILAKKDGNIHLYLDDISLMSVLGDLVLGESAQSVNVVYREDSSKTVLLNTLSHLRGLKYSTLRLFPLIRLVPDKTSYNSDVYIRSLLDICVKNHFNLDTSRFPDLQQKYGYLLESVGLICA